VKPGGDVRLQTIQARGWSCMISLKKDNADRQFPEAYLLDKSSYPAAFLWSAASEDQHAADIRPSIRVGCFQSSTPNRPANCLMPVSLDLLAPCLAVTDSQDIPAYGCFRVVL
jgi:hypothetical protein